MDLRLATFFFGISLEKQVYSLNRVEDLSLTTIFFQAFEIFLQFVFSVKSLLLVEGRLTTVG